MTQRGEVVHYRLEKSGCGRGLKSGAGICQSTSLLRKGSGRIVESKDDIVS